MYTEGYREIVRSSAFIDYFDKRPKFIEGVTELRRLRLFSKSVTKYVD